MPRERPPLDGGNAIGMVLLDKVASSAPTVAQSWVDAGFRQRVVEYGAASA